MPCSLAADLSFAEKPYVREYMVKTTHTPKGKKKELKKDSRNLDSEGCQNVQPDSQLVLFKQASAEVWGGLPGDAGGVCTWPLVLRILLALCLKTKIETPTNLQISEECVLWTKCFILGWYFVTYKNLKYLLQIGCHSMGTVFVRCAGLSILQSGISNEEADSWKNITLKYKIKWNKL